jgi:hypothetical protein
MFFDASCGNGPENTVATVSPRRPQRDVRKANLSDAYRRRPQEQTGSERAQRDDLMHDRGLAVGSWLTYGKVATTVLPDPV